MEDENEIPDVETSEQAFSDEQQDYGEHVGEQQEEQMFGSYQEPRKSESIFSFFKHILGIKDSSKVGNLDKRELGNLDLSVRNCENLAKLGYILNNKSFHDYFMQKAEITLATSMSKKGWLPELVVSQKRFTQRAVQPVAVTAPQQQKKGFLGIGGSKSQ